MADLDTDGPPEGSTGLGSESGDASETGESGAMAEPRCGDGVIDDGEACDLGLGNSVGAGCTPDCVLPRCGDGRLAPEESCDGDETRDDFDVTPAECSDACTWLEPTLWRDDWGDHGGHDDAVTRVLAADDGTVVALGWQRAADEQIGSLRGYGATGEVAWTAELGPRECGNWGPQLAVRPSLAAVLRQDCTGAPAQIQAFDAAGQPAWTVDLPASGEAGVGLWSTVDGFVAYAASLDEDGASLHLTAVDDAGVQSWSVTPEHPVWAVASAGAVLYGVSSETMWSRDPGDGSITITTPLRSASARMVVDSLGRPIVLRKPTNALDPFALEAFEPGLEHSWSVPFVDVPPLLRGTYGLDARDGRIAVAFEDQVEDFGPFDTAATVHVFDEDGDSVDAFTLQGPDHGRDTAHDVALVPDGGIVVGGAFSRAETGRDGYVARIDEERATSSAYVQPRRERRGPEPLVRPDGAVPKTVFIDVSGPFLRSGHDPVGAELSCVDGAFGFPAFSWSPAAVDEALEELRATFEPFAIRIVASEPPAYLPYTRVVVGGAPEELGSNDGHRGLACTIDCGDQAWSEAVFVFGETAPTPGALAQTVAHELGHAIGLDHVDSDDALMNPTSSEANVVVEDACRPTIDPACASSHEAACPGGSQNSYAEFLAAVGPRISDAAGPSITIDADDAPPREPVSVRVQVEDDTPGFGWELRVVELGWTSRGRTDGAAEFELALPEGRWTLEVEATDQLGNLETQRVRVDVG